jgi:protein subunit release factor A
MNDTLFSWTRKDFQVDTFRSPGPGGQNVNKVETGVRITHIPSGLSSSCVETRSQSQNRKIAFERLCGKLVEHYITRRIERERIPTEVVRTYNEPNNRVKDSTGFEQTYKEVMDDIGEMIEQHARSIRDVSSR